MTTSLWLLICISFGLRCLVMKLFKYLELQGRGAAAKLAQAIGAHAPDVSSWTHGLRAVPLHHCLNIERETGGAVTAEELRSDQTWLRIFDASWPHPGGRPLIDVAHSVSAGAKV